MSPGKFVRTEGFDRVLRITLDRPEARNAVNSELLAELIDAMLDSGADPEVRAVVLTGAGDRAFIAGADIKEMSRKTPREGREFATRGHRLTRLIEEMGKPVIAAINGAAFGGGCELAIACDVRIASDRAVLGQPEVKLGILPGWGATIRLPRIVGEGVAREMIFSGRVLSAEEALRVGLVNAVVPHEQLSDEALKLAINMADGGPIAVAFAKRSMNRARALDVESATEFEANLFALCFSTEDQREGMDAFIEKRAPNFRRR
ncbi:MAG: enoyl-CoA hydratase/isomerase family protein [Chloroflexota bacterium]